MKPLDIIILLVVTVLLVLAWRTAHKKGGCSCGSGSGCAETARAAVTAAIIKKSERGELSQNRQIRGTGFVNCAI